MGWEVVFTIVIVWILVLLVFLFYPSIKKKLSKSVKEKIEPINLKDDNTTSLKLPITMVGTSNVIPLYGIFTYSLDQIHEHYEKGINIEVNNNVVPEEVENELEELAAKFMEIYPGDNDDYSQNDGKINTFKLENVTRLNEQEEWENEEELKRIIKEVDQYIDGVMIQYIKKKKQKREKEQQENEMSKFTMDDLLNIASSKRFKETQDEIARSYKEHLEKVKKEEGNVS